MKDFFFSSWTPEPFSESTRTLDLQRKEEKHEEYLFFVFFIIVIIVIISNGFMYNVKFYISFIPPCFLNDFIQPWYQWRKRSACLLGFETRRNLIGPKKNKQKKHIVYIVLQSGRVKFEEAHGFIFFVCLFLLVFFLIGDAPPSVSYRICNLYRMPWWICFSSTPCPNLLKSRR